MAVQGSGLGIASPTVPKKSKDWTLRHVYNLGTRRGRKGRKRRINTRNILKRRRLGTGELRKSRKGRQVPETVFGQGTELKPAHVAQLSLYPTTRHPRFWGVSLLKTSWFCKGARPPGSPFPSCRRALQSLSGTGRSSLPLS